MKIRKEDEILGQAIARMYRELKQEEIAKEFTRLASEYWLKVKDLYLVVGKE